MNALRFFLPLVLIVSVGATASSAAKIKPYCVGFDPKAEREMANWVEPAKGSCTTGTVTLNGIDYSTPDSKCTPGAANPTLKMSVLDHKGFGTGCERDKATSAHRKAIVYEWYGIKKPKNNSGQKMVCELDHLISIEIGGADTIDNIWPQCGPSRAVLKNRYFKQKDSVENYLAAQVRAGAMQLDEVQAGIARDWTQYLPAAQKYYAKHKERKDGG